MDLSVFLLAALITFMVGDIVRTFMRPSRAKLQGDMLRAQRRREHEQRVAMCEPPPRVFAELPKVAVGEWWVWSQVHGRFFSGPVYAFPDQLRIIPHRKNDEEAVRIIEDNNGYKE